MSRDCFCDLHTHSTASDGTDSPRELAANATKLGIRILALTDHDNVNGVRELAALQSEVRIENTPEYQSIEKELEMLIKQELGEL